MNYITTINNFWAKQLTTPVSSGAAALFFYLLHQANIRRWTFPVPLTNTLIQAQMRISKSSFLRYRSELCEKGYISYYPINHLMGSGYSITLESGAKSAPNPDTCKDTSKDTISLTDSGQASYNNINKKDLNKIFKQKRNTNDKEIYNSGRYDFERIERIARQRIKEQVASYKEEEKSLE